MQSNPCRGAACPCVPLLSFRYPPGHPLAWLESGPESGSELSDERRRELLELGFPDDGYDYLQHMRTLGHGSAALEGPGLSERQEDGAAGGCRSANAPCLK